MESDRVDRTFAWIYFLVGYGFIWAVSGWIPSGWGLSCYTLFYSFAVLGYLFCKRRRLPAESWFWLAILYCIGLPLGLWSMLGPVQRLALMMVAEYWTLSAAGALVRGRTSDWLPVDWLNAGFVLPFGNLFSQAKVLGQGLRGTRLGRRILAVGLGVLIALPLLMVVLPQLSMADAGFDRLLTGIWNRLGENFDDIVVQVILSVPVTAFLFGLIYGALCRRRLESIKRESVERGLARLHILPDLAVTTALLLVCLSYLVFILLQGGYLFSAFVNRLPENFSYAEYARQGFFELCRIAAINLTILCLANSLCRTPRRENRPLRVWNICLSVLSILLITTALSKMWMYIWAYGLTQKRVITTVFLLWLAVVFVLVILWQFRTVSPVRLAVMAGAVLFCLLCVFDWSSWIHRYNATHPRPLAGEISERWEPVQGLADQEVDVTHIP